VPKNNNLSRQNENAVVSNISEEKIEKKKPNISNIPPSTYVWVASNVYGGLIYISQRTGTRIEWSDYNNRQLMTLDEVITMRNTQRSFIEKNWVRIIGFVDAEYADTYSLEELLEYLQIKEYYKDSLCPENIDDVFALSPEEIKKRVPNMSEGVKNNIIVRANDLIKNGKLDSHKKILALEEALKCELSKP